MFNLKSPLYLGNILANGIKVERGLELDTVNAGAPYESPVGVVMPVGK